MYTAECYNSSTPQMLVSGKDGGDALSLYPLELKHFAQGCQLNYSIRDDEPKEDRDEQDRSKKASPEEKEEDNFDMFISSLKVNIPSAQESRGDLEDEDDEGLKTPTSLDQKIRLSLNSPPPAPRKPKSLPLKKRKANRHQRFLLDLSIEVGSLFPMALCEDLGGDKIKKKARQAT